MVAPPPAAPATPAATGTGNFLTSGLASGVLGTVGSTIGGAGTLAKAVGASTVADSLNAEAERARQAAATYRNPDIEKEGLSTPRGIGYFLAQQAPGLAATLVPGGMIGRGLEALGVGSKLATGAGFAAAAYPGAVGSNAEATGHPSDMTQGQSIKAAALGVPEAAIAAFPLGRLENMFLNPAAKGVGAMARAAGGQAAAQAAAAAGQDVLTQQMSGQPLDTSEVVHSAVGGALAGGVFGAATHGLARLSPHAANEDIVAQIDNVISPKAPEPEPAPTAPPETGVEQVQEHLPQPGDFAEPAPPPVAEQPGVPGAEAPPIYGQEEPDTQTRINEEDTQSRIEPPQDAAVIAESVKKMPQPLRDLAQPGTDPAVVADAIRERIGDAEPGTPVKNSLREAAQAYGVADDEGKLLAKPAEEMKAADIVQDQHQARGEAIDDLKAQTDNPELHAALDDATTKLAAPGQGDVPAADKTIRDVTKAVEGEKTTAALVQKPKVAELQANVDAAKKSLVALTKIAPSTTDSTVHDNHVKAEWQAGLKQQAQRLKIVSDALKTGDPDSALRGLPDTHFANDAMWGNDKFNDAAQSAFQAHAEKEQDVLDSVHKAFPPDGLFGAPSSESFNPAFEARAKGDYDIAAMVHAGGSMRDVLSHIKDNGSNGLTKAVANKLLKTGVDPKISFEALDPNSRLANSPPTSAGRGATYDPFSDSVQLHQGTDLERLALHEAVHSASMKALEGAGPASKAFRDLYQEAILRNPGDKVNNTIYGLTDAHEFMSEAFSNPKFQDWLRGQSAVAEKTTLWSKFKSAVAKLLGFEGGQKTFLDQVLERGSRVMDENETAAGPKPASYYSAPARADEAVHDLGQAAEQLRARVESAGTGIGVGLQKAALGWRPPPDIANAIAEHIPSAPKFIDASRATENQQNSWNKVAGVQSHAYKALAPETRTQHDNVAAATAYGIDARKPWEQQSPDLATARNAEQLRQLHVAAYRDWGRMADDGKAAYETMVDTRQTHRLSGVTMALDNLVKSSYADVTKGFENSAAKDFQFNAEAHDAPALAKQAWVGELTKRLEGVDEALNASKMTNGGQVADALAPLDRMSKAGHAALDSLNKAPSLPLGHGTGDYFVSGALPVKEDGSIDEAKLAKLAPRFEKAGFGSLALEAANENADMFTRLKTREQVRRLEDVFRTAQADGLLGDKKIASGLVSTNLSNRASPAWIEDVLASMKKNQPDAPEGADESTQAMLSGAWDQHIKDMRQALMDAVPDSSPLKILAKKENVQAFAKEMGETFQQKAAAASRMLAVFGSSPDKGAAISGMRDELKALKHTDMPIAQKEMIQNSANELLSRDANRPVTAPNSIIAAVKGISHRLEIGTSVPYMLTLLSQNLTLTMPRLGAVFGHLKAADGFSKATMPTFQAMRTMLKGPEAFSAGMRLDTMLKSGMSESDARFLVHGDNAGWFNASSQTHAMAAEHHGDGIGAKIANWSTTLGLYSEMQPRIQMALAVKRLWRGEAQDGDLYQFTKKLLDKSQLPWDAASTPRQVTRSGFGGELSPLINQFMGYKIRFTTMMYREFESAFGNGSAADKAEARQFLAGHLGAITVLAGSMGLPMTAVFASVYDKLADILTGDPQHDIQASYRMHLKNMFGPALGEVIARGAPRALGIDLDHLGEQTIAPGSSLINMLTEKRKFEDAEKDTLKSLAGSAVGLGASMIMGLRDMTNGDYLQGAQKMVPETLRGPVEALQASLYGFRDKSGQKLPITANAKNIALKAMGLDPSSEAEYEEEARVNSGLSARQQAQSQNILQHLSLALQRGDQGNFQSWVGESARYGQEHPGMRPPMADLQRYMATHMKNTAVANATGTPVGVRPNNLATRGMVGFGNLQSQ